MAKQELTPKQAEFCSQYLIDLNGKQAAVRAGYSPKTAEFQASRLLSSVKVQQHLTKLQAKARKQTEITRNEVLGVLASILRSDVPDYFHDGKIKDFKDLTPDQRKAIESIKVNKSGVLEFRLPSKIQAVTTVSKILGYDAAQDLNVQLQSLDEAALDAIINRLISKDK